jgi:hypothetical protein
MIPWFVRWPKIGFQNPLLALSARADPAVR